MWLDVLLIWIGVSLPVGSVVGKAMKDPISEEPAPLPERVFASSID